MRVRPARRAWLLAALAGPAMLTACQLLLDTDGANGVARGPGDGDGGIGAGDGAGPGDEGPVYVATPAAQLSGLLDADVTPEAVVLGDQLYVAGRHGTHGWVGRFDHSTLAPLGGVDFGDIEDGTTTLLAIAAAPDGGLVVAGRIDRDGSASEAVEGAITSDLTASPLHVVTAPAEGAAAFTRVGAAYGITWASGTVTDETGDAQAWFAAGDNACPLVETDVSNATPVRVDLAIGNDVIVFVNRADHEVSYTLYTKASCDHTGFEGNPVGEVNVFDSPDFWATASNGPYVYAAANYDSNASTFFVVYSRTDGQRPQSPTRDGGGGTTRLPNTPSTFVAAAHDGVTLFALGTVADAELVEAVGDAGVIQPIDVPRPIPIPGYGARAIAVAPAPDRAFYLVGTADGGPYVVQCDKTTGCLPAP